MIGVGRANMGTKRPELDMKINHLLYMDYFIKRIHTAKSSGYLFKTVLMTELFTIVSCLNSYLFLYFCS